MGRVSKFYSLVGKSMFGVVFGESQDHRVVAVVVVVVDVVDAISERLHRSA
jgi:hypothetical protein